MGNHFHLLLETPQSNLVAGMKWLLGVFSQGWNRARGRQGHVFQGRHKSVPVNGSDADRYYFRTTVGFEWIAIRLHMGHPGSVSRLVCNVKRDRKLEKRVNELENLS